MYLMIDPFNRSYNPAKVIKDSDIAISYTEKFQEAIKSIRLGHINQTFGQS